MKFILIGIWFFIVMVGITPVWCMWKYSTYYNWTDMAIMMVCVSYYRLLYPHIPYRECLRCDVVFHFFVFILIYDDVEWNTNLFLFYLKKNRKKKFVLGHIIFILRRKNLRIWGIWYIRTYTIFLPTIYGFYPF